MTDHITLFRNRMGLANWGLMVLGFTLAVPLVIFQGAEPWLAIAICGGLALFAVSAAAIIITLMGRTHVAELTQHDAMLDIEMLSPLGRGRRFSLDAREARDWRVTKRGPAIRFRHGQRDFTLPLSGATVDWPALRQVVPSLQDTPK